MFDIRKIREDAATFDAGLARRGVGPMSAQIIELDQQRREAETRAQEIQARRNALSKEVGQKKAKGEDASDLMAEVSQSKDALAAAEDEARHLTEGVEALISGIPNLPQDDVPDGTNEDDNVVVRTWGEPVTFAFEAKEHFDIGESLGGMDFETAAKISGARFVILSGDLARLERALGSFMLDHNTERFGYREISPPALVRDSALFGTGQLPKFAADLFRTEENMWLIPTAEVPLTNMLAGEVLKGESLPQRFTAQTWCFRSEAGAAGKDTRGMIRQHQFSKVEMVSAVHPDQSTDELERMTECAESVLKELGLPFRTVVLCTGDMGFSAQKTYDIEVWLPGQGKYREISSCSNCGDFQARRMKARFKGKDDKKPQFVHTLNGSGLAVGRTLVAVLENYQQADGSVVVPTALRPYMGGVEVLKPNAT